MVIAAAWNAPPAARRVLQDPKESRMLARSGLDPQEALVCTMVLVAATGGITDREIGVMSGLVQTLPSFHEFSAERLSLATDAAVALLREEDGLAHAASLIR